ncbi:type II toxin-antitoxin system RelE/ParE family toxin [Bartonella queenslandensis]|uniref:type II toxin-antitoxin system RelE/ParE family toxin n=1 Tax=Bartonella queenslandensis TaxID=481138 RepID=UPI001BA9D511|nr:type II toxin-antitoxin system RelE/ParE family toxin [Bartonella queenslandensis]
MQVLQTNSFKKAVKKLHANQKEDLDQAVRDIISDPTLGDAKIGDLAGIFVHKFKMAKQLTLLAYSYEDQTITLTLLALGSHENFYRDLKQN